MVSEKVLHKEYGVIATVMQPSECTQSLIHEKYGLQQNDDTRYTSVKVWKGVT